MSDFLPYSPELIAERVTGAGKRILLFGESGIGKSRLAVDLAGEFARAGHPCSCISADPGSPSFGIPGAVCLGEWRNGGWRLLAFEALCSLDAGRFRLPLVTALAGLIRRAGPGILLVDAPGITRSVAGAELLTELVRAAEIDTVLALVRRTKKIPLANELATAGSEIFFIRPSPDARQPGKQKRAERRTRLWDAYLQNAVPRRFLISETTVTGTPPPPAAKKDWHGRQIALLRKGRTLAMGEILDAGPGEFRIRIAETGKSPDQFLVRDAYRDSRGLLGSFRPAGTSAAGIHPPPDVAPWTGIEDISGPRPVVRIGDATCMLANGVFGDPLLHLRLHNRKRSFLFDLGEGVRLPARLAHQVSDVFISHAHIDHICGFLWLMRSRIGLVNPCRLFGPPGLSDRVFSLINGIHWDRIGDAGPRFDVFELHDESLIEFGIRAGRKIKEERGGKQAAGGILLDDPDCRMRAVTLSHAGIPVLAYSLEFPPKYNVDKESLTRLGLPSGPWLRELKKNMAAGADRTRIRLPGGYSAGTGNLAGDLLQVTPAGKLVYATDLSDTATNREKLTGLAMGAHTMFCEAAFIETDSDYAVLSGHLTARGCGEVAAAAGVGQLVPFHFSRRYEKQPSAVYSEVKLHCRGIKLVAAPSLQT